MEKEFVQYELAVKLKELGFNEECIALYQKNKKFKFADKNNHIANFEKIEDDLDFYKKTYPEMVFNFNSEYFLTSCVGTTAPLWQQAFDWFRVNYGLHAIVYQVEIEDKSIMWDWDIVDNGSEEEVYKEPLCNTYEQSRHACLEKLIELVKNGN